MDSSMNFYEEDEIRPPDKIKRETLLQDNRSVFDKQLDEALYQSLQLYQNEVQKHEELEKKLLQQQREEIEKRKNLVKPILFELNRISKFDPKINNIFEIIDPILDSYCGLAFEDCSLDKKTYHTIFNGLTKTRINMDILMSIIKSE
jgi:hypothetical protein